MLLLLAPLLSGISRKIRAKMHSRIGPMGVRGVLQDYRDIAKLMTRQEVTPVNSGVIFRAMPFILISSMLTVAMTLPIITQGSLLGSASDLITLIYIFALFRFFFSLSGLDSGSPFAGLGASRELVIGVLVEPVLMLSLLVMALIAGSTNIGAMSMLASANWGGDVPTAAALAMVACSFAVFIEMGKIPFDYPEAEQELQEGPLSEYSGVGLALVSLGIKLKQTVIAALFISVFLPFGSAQAGGSLTFGTVVPAMVIFAAKLLAVFVLSALYENSLARGRFLLTSKVTWSGFGIAALAFGFYFTKL
jgi:hydrogenase-4 component C